MTVSVLSKNTGATYANVQDTTLYEYDPTSPFFNTAAQVEASSKTVGDRAHIVLEFLDISSITSTDVASAVALKLRVGTGPGTLGIAIYELKTVPTYGQASWNNRLTATAWTTAGALNSTDANLTALDTQTDGGNDTFLTFNSAALLALVNAKIAAGQPLRLLICRSNDVAYDASGVVFQSCEGTDTFRPELTITHAAGGSPTVSTVSSNSANEGSNIVHTVTLSGATAAITNYAASLAGGTATGGGADYTSALASLTYSAGVTVSGGNLVVPSGVSSFTVTVPTATDVATEGNETYTLTVGGVAGTGTIVDVPVFAPKSIRRFSSNRNIYS